jgi:hypothetical protein
MRLIAALAFALASVCAFAQQDVRPIRIRIRHADPWFVKAMLEGRQVFSPEISTLMAFTGAGPVAAAAAGRLFEGGTFMVNPTDNSLWFIPNRPSRPGNPD